MRPTLNRLMVLCSFALIAGCSHWPVGSDSQDGGRLPADSALSSDSSDDATTTSVDGGAVFDSSMSDSNTGDVPDASVVGVSDGGTGDASDGGSHSDASVPQCSSDSDCSEGEDCVNGECVCDGGDGDEFCEQHHKAWVCHYPPGHPENRRNLCVGTPSVTAHQDHGDTLGACL